MSPLTHAKVSGISDGGDTSLVRPSDWNAAHVGTPPFHGVRARMATGTPPTGQTINDSTFTAIKYPVNLFDTDGFHPITTDANLSGTLSKTGSNVTITGASTSFTTELAQ